VTQILKNKDYIQSIDYITCVLGIYSLGSDPQLYFFLSEDCVLVGNKDETSELNKPEVSFDIRDAAININPKNTNQFEVVGKG